MTTIYYKTTDPITPLLEILPLESNGPGNLSVPRQIVDVEFLDTHFLTPTDSFVINDDVSSRFVQGFQFSVIGSTLYDGTYTVNGGAFAPGAVVAQVVDGKTHIPVTDIATTSVPYSFIPAAATNVSPTTPHNYLVTWQVQGNLTAVVAANDTIQVKRFLYNGTRVTRTFTVVSVTLSGSFTNIVTSLYDNSVTMPVLGVDTQSVFVSPAPTPVAPGYVQYAVTTSATSLMLVGKGVPAFNATTSWGSAMQANLIHMLENFAHTAAPASPLNGQLWFDTNVTGPALQLYNNASWYGVVAEGLPVQGNINMNDFKIAKSLNATTTYPYVASSTGWGNNDQEVLNLGTADGLYIAKTGGYDTNLANRSGTMSGSLSVTPYIEGRETLTTSVGSTGILRLGSATQAGISLKSNDSSYAYFDFVNSTNQRTNVTYTFGTNLLEFGKLFNEVSGASAVSINLSTGEVATKKTTFTNNQEFITKLYSDSTYVNVAGDTMTGALILNADPTTALGAATKQYVDMFTSGIIWLTPVLDPNLFDDSLSAPPVVDAYTTYHKTFIVNGTGTGAWTGFNGHLMAWDGAAWQSVLGRAVAIGDRFGVFAEPDNNDPLSTLPAGGVLNQAGKIATVTGIAPYTYTFYTPAEPDAFSVKGVFGNASAYQSPHMGHSYTFRGVYGSGSYGTGYQWIEFSGPQMIIDGAGIVYDGNTLSVGAGTGIAVNADSVQLDLTYTDNRYVNTTGDTMTGSLTLSADPTLALHAATKQYVDGVSLQNFFTAGRSIAAPNATVPVHSLTATGTEANIDAAFVPKGTGAITGHVADNTAAGGNKRGNYAVDLQVLRTLADEVASGLAATVSGGTDNKASNTCATVAGGGGNYASATYSFVGGGALNISSGNRSTVAGGNQNAASGAYATVSGGSGHVASADGTTVAGGTTCSATAIGATIGGGSNNTASGQYSTIPGGLFATTRGNYGRYSYASGVFATLGDAQTSNHVLRYTTTDATPSVLSGDGVVIGSTNTTVIPDNHAYTAVAYITARNTSTGDMASWRIEGAVKRGTGAASTALVGTPVVTAIAADAGAASWVVSMVANTTRGSVEIQVVGVAATTIHWVCKLSTVEVG